MAMACRIPYPLGKGTTGNAARKAGKTMKNNIRSLTLLVNLGIYGVLCPLSRQRRRPVTQTAMMTPW
jgi:hypothetical protein